jgi:peptidoglycan/xylan/chitin deacetylase (PgdA/CDA1 family)
MSTSDALPKVVFSLDFELRWGLHDRLRMDFDAYRKNLEGVRDAVPALLGLFAERGVRATWATVGAVACHNWDDYFRRAPPPPRYANPCLAFSRRYADIDPNGALHFAPDLVRLVSLAEGQDLGTHTFSHLYLGEMGVMLGDVEADHKAVVTLFREAFAHTPTSLVFPRNQVAFLRFYCAEGITAWRDNEADWYHILTQHADHTLVRARRLADALAPWRTRGGQFEGGCTPSTLFVRVNLPVSAWKVHLAKIAAEASRARHGDVLHFWLHPHNIGDNVRRGIERLNQVLETLERRLPKGTTYTSMRDLSVSAAQSKSERQRSAK